MNCSISVNPENLSTKINPLICHLHADFESRCVQKTIFQVMRGINFQIYQYIGCCILFTISSVFATVNIYQHAPKFVNFIQSLKLSALCWFQNQVFQLIPEFCKLNLIRLFFILNKTHQHQRRRIAAWSRLWKGRLVTSHPFPNWMEMEIRHHLPANLTARFLNNTAGIVECASISALSTLVATATLKRRSLSAVQSAVVLVRFDILPKEQLWSGHTWQTYHLVLICLWSPIGSIIQCSMVSYRYCSFPNKNW